MDVCDDSDLKVTKKTKLKENRAKVIARKVLKTRKRTPNDSGTVPLLSSMEGDGSTHEEETASTKSRSKCKSFGGDSMFLFKECVSSSANEKRRKMIDARRLRRHRQKVYVQCTVLCCLL